MNFTARRQVNSGPGTTLTPLTGPAVNTKKTPVPGLMLAAWMLLWQAPSAVAQAPATVSVTINSEGR